MNISRKAIAATVAAAVSAAAPAAHATGYNQINLLANSADHHAQSVDPTLLNAWGIAIRPAGFGGHFWLTSNGDGASKEYVGDVGSTLLFQDESKIVDVPGPGGNLGTPTGVVFNGGTQYEGIELTGGGRTLYVRCCALRALRLLTAPSLQLAHRYNTRRRPDQPYAWVQVRTPSAHWGLCAATRLSPSTPHPLAQRG